jgi:hypothetical protein
VSWNGHYLVGYFVAISLTALTGTGYLALYTGTGWATWTTHAPVPCATSLISPRSDAGCTPAAPAPTPTKGVLSSCQKLHKAIHNGNEAAIASGMKVVIADETVDATSRKVARHYTFRDKGNECQQKRNLLILQDSCKS